MEGFKPSQEKPKPISMSREDFRAMANTFGEKMNSPEFKGLLEKYGIALNSGPALIEVEGIQKRMVTDEGDFGTIYDDEK